MKNGVCGRVVVRACEYNFTKKNFYLVKMLLDSFTKFYTDKFLLCK